MSIDATLAELVLTVGAPILVFLYLLEGLLVGKLLHPSLLLIEMISAYLRLEAQVER